MTVTNYSSSFDKDPSKFLTENDRQNLQNWREAKQGQLEYADRWMTVQLIEQCAHSKSVKLDLSGLGLTSIPLAIWNLSHLECLDLRDNNLEPLDEEDIKKKLTKLKWLILDPPLKAVPIGPDFESGPSVKEAALINESNFDSVNSYSDYSSDEDQFEFLPVERPLRLEQSKNKEL